MLLTIPLKKLQKTKPRTKLDLSDTTHAIYLVIDNPQSSQIPEKNRFVMQHLL